MVQTKFQARVWTALRWRGQDEFVIYSVNTLGIQVFLALENLRLL